MKNIDELNQALKQLLPDQSISHDIFTMFVREQDKTLKQDTEMAVFKRFFVAQKLYQIVTQKRATEAVFYRIDDRTKLEALYQFFRQQIKQEFLVAPHTSIEVTRFFNNIIQTLQVINPRNRHQTIKLEVANYLLKAHNQSQLTISNINSWFTDQQKPIQELASHRFYGVVDINQAYDVGTIYGPGADHNWGVNASWALGVTLARLPIRIISELNVVNSDRSHPDPNQILNPSAFTLEISIAVKMGYGINITNENVVLIPPRVLNNHLTSGRPGNGPIPNKQEQIDIFEQCILARELHTLLPQNNGENLRNHIHNVCTTGTANQKVKLAIAMDFLGKGNSLPPILNTLFLREYVALNAMLADKTFSEVAYDTLKNTIRVAVVNAMRTSNVQVFRDWVNGICTGDNVAQKKEFATTLDFMGYQGSLNEVLNTFSLKEHLALKKMLTVSPFSGIAYNNLRHAALNAESKLTSLSSSSSSSSSSSVPPHQTQPLKIRNSESPVRFKIITTPGVVQSEKLTQQKAVKLKETLIQLGINSRLIKILPNPSDPNSYQITVESNKPNDISIAKIKMEAMNINIVNSTNVSTKTVDLSSSTSAIPQSRFSSSSGSKSSSPVQDKISNECDLYLDPQNIPLFGDAIVFRTSNRSSSSSSFPYDIFYVKDGKPKNVGEINIPIYLNLNNLTKKPNGLVTKISANCDLIKQLSSVSKAVNLTAPLKSYLEFDTKQQLDVTNPSSAPKYSVQSGQSSSSSSGLGPSSSTRAAAPPLPNLPMFIRNQKNSLSLKQLAASSHSVPTTNKDLSSTEKITPKR